MRLIVTMRLIENGTLDADRTRDKQLKRLLLYQLSYQGVRQFGTVGGTRTLNPFGGRFSSLHCFRIVVRTLSLSQFGISGVKSLHLPGLRLLARRYHLKGFTDLARSTYHITAIRLNLFKSAVNTNSTTTASKIFK